MTTVNIVQSGDILEIESSQQTIEAQCPEYTIDLQSVIVEGVPYEGPYTVTPKVEQQMLYTNNKTMHDDVTIFGVPKYEVRNEYGTTCVIAEEA